MAATAPESPPQDRRRLMIMLAVLGGLVLLGLVYFLFLSGGGDSDTESAEPAPKPTATESVEPDAVEPTEPAVVVLGTSNRDPFETVVEEEEDTTTTESTKSSSQQNKSSSTNTTKSTTKKTTEVTGSSNNDAQKEPSGSDNSDAKKEKDGPVTPEVVDGETDDGKRVSVKLVEVNPDYAIARVNGNRTRLYVSIPGAQGVTYVAPVGTDCAWIGRSGDEVRVSVCEGEIERL